METSRSCHGECHFCEGYLFRKLNPGSGYSVKSADRVIQEIQYVIENYQYRVFSFSDDNFFADGSENAKQRVKDIANALIKNKIRIRFTIECRADDISEEIFTLLKRAGLCKVFVGIESGSQSVLNRYNKGTTVEENHKAIQILSKLNIKCHPGYILFDPYTTIQELHETVDFFEPYLEFLFSFSDGVDTRSLYFPYGCKSLETFWPNQSEKFYENICYNGIKFKFKSKEVEKVYEIYSNYLNDLSFCEGANLLKRRILSLKKALSDIE